MISELAQFCEHCGFQLAADNKFCQGCGKPIQSLSPPPAPPVYTPPAAAEVPMATPPPVSHSQAAAPPTYNPQPPAAPQTPVATGPAISANLDNYTKLKQLYYQAAQVDPMQRDSFLVSACEGDASLLQELRSMFVTQAASYAGRSQNTDSAAASNPATASQAYMIGVYRLMRELGRGGMGVVYLAVRDDGAFRKNVALKLLLRECVNAEFISRFKQERQVLAALDHPNIARILDGGDTTDGMPYYVMEYVEGMPLDRYCDQQRLSVSGRIKIFQQVCLAVDYLHQNSILHRDLKPSNILVSSDGVVKLLDFGIAKVVGAGSFANPDLTTAQGRPMTPTYASPEQLSGATLHKTSDLYSLGAILYTLLTGRSAYNDLDDKLSRIAAREMPTKPSTNIREDLKSAETTAQFRRAMMGELDSIVLMTMQIDPKDRYQSAADLAQDLQRFLDGSPVTAYHTSAANRGVKLIRRKATAIAVLCGFLALGAFGAWEWMRLERQKSEAAANDARLGSLVDQLESRLDKVSAASTTVAPPIEDVRQLKDAFQKDFAAGADHDALLAKGVKYLDHVRAVSQANPNLDVQVGDAYQQLGSLQESAAPASHAALVTYQKAATTLVSADAQGNDTEQVKQHLATVNARIRALGGSTVTLPVQTQTPDNSSTAAASSTPLVTDSQPVKTARDTRTTPPIRQAAIAVDQTVQAQPPPKATPAISAETEDQLITVESKVQITDQTIAPVRQSLERDGQTLNAETLARIARMHASLDRAKNAIAAGNEADAKDSLAAADALATKLLSSVGR